MSSAGRALGFNRLTSENWLSVADAMGGRYNLLPDGSIVPTVADDWLTLVLAPRILETTPVEIEALFEAARGVMAYGWFFYPSMTIAAQQLFRVAEAAARIVCLEHGAPRNLRRSFKDSIDWLVAHSLIPGQAQPRWNALRSLRNIGSHPERQEHFGPALAIRALTEVGTLVNSLPFANRGESSASS